MPGVGSHLLAQCLHTAHAHGARTFIAHTDQDDQAGIRLLASGGFTTLDNLTIHHRRL